MAFCPFRNGAECDPDCVLFARGMQECGMLYQGKLIEAIHDMLVELRQLIGQVSPPATKG